LPILKVRFVSLLQNPTKFDQIKNQWNNKFKLTVLQTEGEDVDELIKVLFQNSTCSIGANKSVHASNNKDKDNNANEPNMDTYISFLRRIIAR
jgi:hypothetical protein